MAAPVKGSCATTPLADDGGDAIFKKEFPASGSSGSASGGGPLVQSALDPAEATCGPLVQSAVDPAEATVTQVMQF